MTTPPGAQERAAIRKIMQHYPSSFANSLVLCDEIEGVLAKHVTDRVAQAVQARDEEWDQREGAEHCPACHGRLPDRMAIHLQAEVAESERVKQLTYAFETALRWVHPLHRERIADLATLRARPAESQGEK